MQREVLVRAAKDIASREKPDALSVVGFFEGDDVYEPFLAFGEAIWAPNEKWEDAGSSEKKEVSVEMGNPITGEYPPKYTRRL